jgi:hypothetical protein
MRSGEVRLSRADFVRCPEARAEALQEVAANAAVAYARLAELGKEGLAYATPLPEANTTR